MLSKDHLNESGITLITPTTTKDFKTSAESSKEKCVWNGVYDPQIGIPRCMDFCSGRSSTEDRSRPGQANVLITKATIAYMHRIVKINWQITPRRMDHDLM
ncbi:hypothetical protein TNIN_311021 [Trichonephila inaurata madagascariensis]|uniref:Uncharacterized protein n=1 Tax=Trichonephila inaurata madagascariensis TaxID=2747483 RepID=A0A8X6XS38_9ARAC|nr:hypothetical protein TNIN_311021 [Trichonephila inaurata madagascariensis]